MDAGTGFEPVWTESKSAILPLDDPAIIGVIGEDLNPCGKNENLES